MKVSLCARRTVQRVRRQEGWRVMGPARRPQCPPRPDAKVKADGVNDVGCVDLAFDVTPRGATVKFLTIIDEGSHSCIDIVASGRLGALAVVAALQEAIRRPGQPRHLRSDNGGEFIAPVLQAWLKTAGIVARFIEPGSPWQNGVNESFNGRFRDECLNRELLGSMLEAQVIARNFRDEYNEIRPHSSIAYKAPADYRAELLPPSQLSTISLTQIINRPDSHYEWLRKVRPVNIESWLVFPAFQSPMSDFNIPRGGNDATELA